MELVDSNQHWAQQLSVELDLSLLYVSTFSVTRLCLSLSYVTRLDASSGVVTHRGCTSEDRSQERLAPGNDRGYSASRECELCHDVCHSARLGTLHTHLQYRTRINTHRSRH